MARPRLSPFGDTGGYEMPRWVGLRGLAGVAGGPAGCLASQAEGKLGVDWPAVLVGGVGGTCTVSMLGLGLFSKGYLLLCGERERSVTFGRRN